jgi:hypothetical protein
VVLLLEVISHFGFRMSWCKLISNLLATSPTRILLNGESGEIIQPLIPMLFILVMYVLNSLFVKVGTEGLLQPLSRLLLDRDSSCMRMMWPCLLRRWKRSCRLLDILMIFGDAYELKTNLHKSNIIPIRYEELSLTMISNTLP